MPDPSKWFLEIVNRALLHVKQNQQFQALLLEKVGYKGKTSYFVIKLVEQFGYIARIHKLYPFRERFSRFLNSLRTRSFCLDSDTKINKQVDEETYIRRNLRNITEMGSVIYNKTKYLTPS